MYMPTYDATSVTRCRLGFSCKKSKTWNVSSFLQAGASHSRGMPRLVSGLRTICAESEREVREGLGE